MRPIIVLYCLIYSSYCQDYKFPKGFKFGVGTSAYQVEGAWNTSDKGESIWDRLAHSHPHFSMNGSNGDVACNAYGKTKEDVQLLKYLGVDFYRFSISWSRILPNGKTDYVNPDGIRYYNELIDELLGNGIKPVVTMYHLDLPQALEDEGGFLNPFIVDRFVKYANVLYKSFGDRIKDWTTFNEPFAICHGGYAIGIIAPRVKWKEIGGYLCGRHLLIAHAKAYRLYNERYRKTQKGRVGITNVNFWFAPQSNTAKDIEAAEAAQQYMLGWFAHPIFSKQGDYPPAMKATIHQLSKAEGLSISRLPEFTSEEIKLIKGTADFFGMNHYTTKYCTKRANKTQTDMLTLDDSNAICFGQQTSLVNHPYLWTKPLPWGFRNTLNWIRKQYNNPEVIITENGFILTPDVLRDCERISYYNSYLTALLQAVHEDGCNVSGYTAWSFMDSYELMFGYAYAFGLYSVDFGDPLRPRTPKMSAHVFRNILRTKKIDWSYTPDGFERCVWSNNKVNNLAQEEL